ncbi:MAG: hypothetical protein U1E03_09650 [Hyphomonadaceae bacterium]
MASLELTEQPAMTMQEERLARNFAEFEHYVLRAQGYLAQGELATAAAHCAIASHIATQNHCGIFWSPRLEKVLTDIGRAVPTPWPARKRPTEFNRILEVCTQVSAVGGHTKMLCQWVKADAERQHSLVLTQHRGPTPDFVHETFEASGGRRVEMLNHRPGGQIEWAKRLREIAKDFDLVILHTHCEDLVPVIAFAETDKHPPVLVLNHADHLFWFGPSICHLSINLRDAAQDLAIGRRGIAPERNILMPTLAEGIVRTRSREEAKRELGIDPNMTVMMSAARRPKYRTMHGTTFADIHADVLEKHPNAMLLVVGAGEPEDWAPVKARFGDRLRSLPEQPQPKIFFEAADIYVDSFPFVSSTSLMEAAGYGTPLVTIFTYPEATRIFGINHVALVGNVMQARSFDEYRGMLSQLIDDPALRERLGTSAKEAVAREHNLPGWMRWLEGVYARALELSALDNRPMLEAVERPSFGEPDIRHEDIFGGNWPTVRVVMSYMGMLPPHQHWAHWQEVRAQGAFSSNGEAASYLLPEWLKRWVKDGILKLPEG